MTMFGWSDTLHAMTNCFSCNAQASSSMDSLHNHAPNARATSGNRTGPSHSSQSLPEALRPLLMNDSTDDEYADSLSLHSNIGESGRKKSKSRIRPPRALSETETDGEDAAAASTRNVQSRTKSKRRGKKKKRDRGTDGWFTAFGYHLFGKKQPAIQLPLTDDEEEDEEEAERRRRRVMRLSGNGSGTTLDSDAAPLDDAAIAAAVGRAHIVRDNEDTAPADPLSGAGTAASVTSGNDDDRRADKEERRRKRREQKERKALERALNAGFSRISSLNSFNSDGGEFEGFQGSGDGASLVALKSPPSERTSVSSKREARSGTSGMDDEDEVADFDGSIYARPIQTGPDPLKISGSRTTTSTATRSSNSTPAPSGRRSGRLSHHRAHSNVSSNDAADEFHEALFNTSSTDPRETRSNDTEERKKKKSKTRSKPSPLASSSTATSSQTPSLPSPPGSAVLGPGLSMSLSSSSQTHSNVTGAVMPTKDTNVKPGLGLEDPFLITPREPTSGLDSSNRGFPSVGFGRRNSTHLNGAFLARRGD